MSSDEYVAKTFERIRRLEGRINAFITVRDEQRVLDEVKMSVKKGGRLAGVLIAVKDNISTRDVRTHVPPRCLRTMSRHMMPP